jgi:hypothetical protein
MFAQAIRHFRSRPHSIGFLSLDGSFDRSPFRAHSTKNEPNSAFAGQIIAEPSLNFDLVTQLRAESTLRLPLVDPRSSCSPDTLFPQFTQAIQLAGSTFKLPSVSAVISDTMSAESRARLEQWERGMISKLGQQGFELYRKNIFARGRKMHKCIELHLAQKGDLDIKSETPEIEPELIGYWTSLKPVFDSLHSVRLTEQRVVHPLLLYRGIVDCVAEISGRLHVIDWKTSEKPKATLDQLFDAPLQAVAYLGALNYDTRLLGNQLKNVAIVVVYEDGTPAHLHCLTDEQCEHYWQVWTQRLHDFWTRKLCALDSSSPTLATEPVIVAKPTLMAAKSRSTRTVDRTTKEVKAVVKATQSTDRSNDSVGKEVEAIASDQRIAVLEQQMQALQLQLNAINASIARLQSDFNQWIKIGPETKESKKTKKS